MNKHVDAQIRRSFNAPGDLTEEIREACDNVAYPFRKLALDVAERLPPSREINLALRHLEEAMDWTLKAIVRYPAGSTPSTSKDSD